MSRAAEVVELMEEGVKYTSAEIAGLHFDKFGHDAAYSGAATWLNFARAKKWVAREQVLTPQLHYLWWKVST